MNFAFSEEQRDLAESARSYLEDRASSEAVRRAMESESGWDLDVWKEIGADLGWTAVHIPEACGGLGLGQVELAALLEAMGERLLCSPFFATLALGANALLVAGDEAQQQHWLPRIAEGRLTATLASCEANGRPDAAGIATTCRREGESYRLRGEKRFVIDGGTADLLIVSARLAGTTDSEGLCLFAVEAGTPGLAQQALPTVDPTRRQGAVRLDDVVLPASARLGAEGEAAPLLERTLDLAAVALAAEQVGGAQRCLDMAVAYALEREQFGRTIASFQAIKHKCADRMVDVEAARSAAYYAACVAALDEGDEDVAREASTVASLAKAKCSEAYFRCAADNIQIHGGVGFTWEYDCHLHFKRAQASQILFGDPAYHRERVAQRIGL